ncbi:cytochrome d ubiquinol oxidase subunit II [Sphingobacterium hungaricum]|uniref:Cytochrome D ubiquinol oxidase subunit II n=1 Tax=Sphingobacterium hungaricum TaxID=2082723 RepID=A0A928V0Z5_9SPHI|nr:cytochrome d ubiquinol oxidase subunit II [Sphingobacterium hungaricum]MBE8714981.1 cytochrome D ubiquinol oxidase subunit II [Sphingobacterium hungaricum]
MIYIVIGFLWLSICLYLVLGGADFGAGIVELFTTKKERKFTKKIMYESIAPIWEANHMWLIIAIVILFVGFPVIYSFASTYLHIPLVLMLVGIIARGTAFTFRHYDAVDDNWQVVYTQIFYYSSLLTPFFFGMIGASAISGSLNPDANNFLDLYVLDWFNLFGIAVGFFTVSICAYLASIYSLRETYEANNLRLMIRKSKQSTVFVVITGLIVFIAAYYSKIPLLERIFGGWIGIVAVSVATIFLPMIYYFIKQRKLIIVRVLAAGQIILILVAATYQLYPDIILLQNGNHLSLLTDSAPEKTISFLAWALMLGSIFILPFLFYLMYSFGRRNARGSE